MEMTLPRPAQQSTRLKEEWVEADPTTLERLQGLQPAPSSLRAAGAMPPNTRVSRASTALVGTPRSMSPLKTHVLPSDIYSPAQMRRFENLQEGNTTDLQPTEATELTEPVEASPEPLASQPPPSLLQQLLALNRMPQSMTDSQTPLPLSRLDNVDLEAGLEARAPKTVVEFLYGKQSSLDQLWWESNSPKGRKIVIGSQWGLTSASAMLSLYFGATIVPAAISVVSSSLSTACLRWKNALAKLAELNAYGPDRSERVMLILGKTFDAINMDQQTDEVFSSIVNSYEFLQAVGQLSSPDKEEAQVGMKYLKSGSNPINSHFGDQPLAAEKHWDGLFAELHS